VIAGIRLRAGKAGSGKGAASMVSEAIRTARAAGAAGEILVRGDSAYGSAAVVNACLKAGVMFSVVLAKNPAVVAAIAKIPDDAWTPVRYPGAVIDPDTGELISDAEVAEIEFTAFASTKTPVTARLVVRRVRDRAKTEELFPVWRCHPFFTDNTEDTAQADITHRQHAIIVQRRMGDLRGHHAQPAPRRRHAGQRPPRRRTRRHPAPTPRRRPGPTGAATTPAGPAPTRTLALARGMAAALGQRGRPTKSSLTRPPPSRPESETETLGRPADPRYPGTTTRSNS